MARQRTLEPDYVEVRVTVPRDLPAVVESLAALSGMSQAPFLRHALFAGLAPYALVSPELAAALPTPQPYERKHQ
jgi:hypothetical protein